MLALRILSRYLLPAVVLVTLATPVGATTLVRRGLDVLTTENEAIVHARVLDIHSYWNVDHTFILTDVRAHGVQSLKGDPADEVVFTILGGTVGTTTTLIVDGPDISPGSEYVLFLSRADLPGAVNRWTVRDLSQGVFDVVRGRAYSQAGRDLLLPDGDGLTDTPGGAEGFLLESLVRQVQDLR